MLISPLFVILPLLICGLIWIAVPQLSSRVKSVLSWIALLILLISEFYIFFTNQQVDFHFNWQPQAGKMGLIFDRASLVLVLLAGLAFIIMNHFRQKSKKEQYAGSVQIGLAFFSLAAAIVALTTDHFLLRFAALEFSGLCVVATTLANKHTESTGWRQVAAIFLNFRVGDLALLAAILIMHAQSGTFMIDQSLAAAQEASLPVQIIASAGLMTAVWVKLSLWPLDWWAKAAGHIPSSLRVWYVDILLPILGAYLLYRVTPLLQVVHHLPDWIITLGILATIVKLLFSNLEHYQRSRSRLVRVLSTICLVAIAISSDQSVVWAFMVYWLIARMIFSFYTVKHEHSPPQQTHKSVILHIASSFTLHVFSLLALIQITFSTQIHFIFNLFLWSFWWLLTYQNIRSIAALRDLNQNKTTSQNNRAAITEVLSGLLAAILLTTTLAIGIYWLTDLVKGHGLWIFSNITKLNQQPSVFNLLVINLAAILLAWLFIKLIAPHTDAFKKAFSSIAQSLHIRGLGSQIRGNNPNLDPLDQSSRFFSLFQKAAMAIYQTLELNSVNKITYWLQKLFTFLFIKIEKFTSVDLWKNAIQKTVDTSRGMQRWHSGYLRQNLFWFLLFIFILMIILHNQNPTFLLPTG